jgi:chromosome partitioning protein
MIIAVTNLKGGVGKSTVAQNLAVCYANSGKKVCILDTDLKQRTTMRWAGERAETLPPVIVAGVEEKQLTQQADALKDIYDVVIIDGRPDLEKLATKTIAISDMVLIPITPKSADVWSLQNFLEWYDIVKEEVKDRTGKEIKARLVLTMYKGNRTITKEIEEYLKDVGVEMLKTRIADRTAYIEAMTLGMGAYEYPKDTKAKEESKNLHEEVESILKSAAN